MGNGRRKKIKCPACGHLFAHWWQHLTIQKKDPAHYQLVESLHSSVLADFGSTQTAVEVGKNHCITNAIVQALWRGAYGCQALRQRSGRLKSKTKPPCPVCGGPLGKHAKIYCSPRCANSVTGASPEVRRKKSKTLRGRTKTASHRKHISESLCHLRDLGALPAMSPEVRAKNSATKKAMGKSKGIIAATAAYMAKTTQEERKESGRNLQKIIKEKYGVSHTYDIPGVRERANAHKAQAMALRIASGTPTNDWGRYKRGWHQSPVAGQQWFQSGWEQKRMETLDQLGVQWTKNHHLRIPYKDPEGKTRYYVPDFLVQYPRTTYIEEVKGYHGKNLPLKIKAAEMFCEGKRWSFKMLKSLEDIKSWGQGLVRAAWE